MVGKVPLYNNPKVDPTSPPAKYISDRGATAEAFGAGVGRATSGLGQQIAQLGDVMVNHGIKMQEEQNAAEATDLFLRAEVALAEKRNAYSSLEGKNAVDALPQYMKDVQGLGADYAKGASNNRVRQQFQQNFARQQAFAVTEGGRYAAGQRKRYESGLTLSLRQRAEQEAVAYAGDDLRFLDAADLTDQSVKQQAQQEGWSEEQTALEMQKSRSNIWEKRLAALSIKDPIRANDLYQTAKPQIDGISRVRIEQHIENGLIQNGARKISEEVVRGYKTREATPREMPAAGEASSEVIRRLEKAESEGQPGVEGPMTWTGEKALGLMQVLPSTAQEQAKLDGLPYREDLMRGNSPEAVAYQRMMGTRVYNRYRAMYGGNDTLAVAAYNAGPARVDQWLKDFGDPRTGGISETEWAQRVPFPETRNHIKKVLGDGVQVASAGQPQVWGDDRDLPMMVREAEDRARAISDNPRFIDAAKNDTIRKYEQDIKAPKIERARLEKEAKEKQAVAQEATMTEYMALAQAGKASTDAIWSDPKLAVLTFSQRNTLQDAMNRMNKPEPMKQVSHNTAVNLVDRIRLPDGDPRKITDTKPIYDALIAEKLTKDDFNFAMGQFQDLRTAGGERLSVRQNDFFNHIRPQIDQSNPLMGKLDQTGKEQMYKFMLDVKDQIERYRKEGKNPYDLFDPAKQDYMGKPDALKPYQTSVNQSMKNFTGTLQNPTNQPKIPAPALVIVPIAPALPSDLQRREGESVADWRKRTGR